MTASSSKRSHRGFTLVEALVALVVLSIGMLGMAGLFVTTLRSGGSAISRMQAVNLASDLADRIRANPDGKAAYEGAAAASLTCMGSTVTPCNSALMAADDLLAWRTEIANTLSPGATGTVDYDDATLPAKYTITVSWSEAKTNSSDSTSLSYQLVMQL
jgi:type IV pilus assembly protein PilV